MKAYKKVLSAVLAAVLVVSMVAGCGKKEEVNPVGGADGVFTINSHHYTGYLMEEQC